MTVDELIRSDDRILRKIPFAALLKRYNELPEHQKLYDDFPNSDQMIRRLLEVKYGRKSVRKSEEVRDG